MPVCPIKQFITVTGFYSITVTARRAKHLFQRYGSPEVHPDPTTGVYGCVKISQQVTVESLFFHPVRIVAPRAIRTDYSSPDFLMAPPFVKSNLCNVTMRAVPRLDITPIPVSPYRIGNPDFMPQGRTVHNTEQRICRLEIRTVRSLYFSPDKTACVWQHVRKSRIFPAQHKFFLLQSIRHEFPFMTVILQQEGMAYGFLFPFGIKDDGQIDDVQPHILKNRLPAFYPGKVHRCPSFLVEHGQISIARHHGKPPPHLCNPYIPGSRLS